MTDYNECPACEHEIFNMQSEFVAAEYQTYFDMNCPNCGALLEVDVTVIPVFNFRVLEEKNDNPNEN